MPDLIIIGDHTPDSHPDANAGMKGLIPRSLDVTPVGYSAVIPPSTLTPFSYDVMVQMIADQERAGSRNSDILRRGDGGKTIPSLDQNGQGYCASYGTTGAMQGARARMNLPYKKLSGHANACILKNYRDEGGWGAQYLEIAIQKGIPDTDHWAEKSMARSNDTASTWANAKLYIPDVVVADLAAPVYNRDLAYGQQLTVLLMGGFTIDDYDWWGHCVMGCDAVNGASQRTVTRGTTGKIVDLKDFELMWGMNDAITKGLSKRIRNSWTDRYGDIGFAVLTGAKAQSSNAVAIMTAAA